MSLRNICLLGGNSFISHGLIITTFKNSILKHTKRYYVRRIREIHPKIISEDDKSRTKPLSTEKERVEDLLRNSATNLGNESTEPGDVWSSSPYSTKFRKKDRDPAKLSFRPNIDPKQTSIILFPGQGSQFVGMGKKLIEYPLVKDMYDVASEILKYDLKKICFEGPKSELDKTMYCQPAVLVTSLAAVQKLKDEKPQAVENCISTAGFSVGEFAALVFAGGISFEDAVRVVKVRAEAMQAASEIIASGMMTVFFQAGARIGYACDVAKEWCKKLGIEQPECRIANYLYPNCKVLAGNEEALQFIEMNAKEFGIRRFKHLSVSGAFHTDLMFEAEAPLRQILEKVKISPIVIPVHSNLDGKRYKDEKHIRQGLVKQMSKPVKWEQILHILYSRKEGVDFPYTYECGPGNTLKTILKMVNAKAFSMTESVEV